MSSLRTLSTHCSQFSVHPQFLPLPLMGITQVYLEQIGILIMYLHSQAINLHKPQIQFIILVLVFLKKSFKHFMTD